MLSLPSLSSSTHRQKSIRSPLLHQCAKVWWIWHRENCQGFWWRRMQTTWRKQCSGTKTLPTYFAFDESRRSMSFHSSIRSANIFCGLFPASFSALSEKDGEPGPLLRAVTANATALPPACVVFPDTSIAKVIREMVDKRTRRVTIQRQDGLIVGAVRASDIILMLLHAQHTSLR